MSEDRPFETPFSRNLDYHGDMLLFRSRNFTVRSAWEVVTLQGRHLPRDLYVGDHYGGPEAGVIDREERWCVTVGCGVIVYRLAPPWDEYVGIETPQWWDYGNDPSDILSLVSVTHVDGDRFLCTSDPDHGDGRRYEVLAEARIVRPVE